MTTTTTTTNATDTDTDTDTVMGVATAMRRVNARQAVYHLNPPYVSTRNGKQTVHLFALVSVTKNDFVPEGETMVFDHDGGPNGLERGAVWLGNWHYAGGHRGALKSIGYNAPVTLKTPRR